MPTRDANVMLARDAEADGIDTAHNDGVSKQGLNMFKKSDTFDIGVHDEHFTRSGGAGGGHGPAGGSPGKANETVGETGNDKGCSVGETGKDKDIDDGCAAVSSPAVRA